MTSERVRQILSINKKLRNIPILFNVDLGHVPATATFPVGGSVKLTASKGCVEIKIIEH